MASFLKDRSRSNDDLPQKTSVRGAKSSNYMGSTIVGGFGVNLTKEYSNSISPSNTDVAKMRSSMSDDGNRRVSLQPLANNNVAEQKELKSTFIDAQAMKEKVRQNLMKPQHNAKDAYKTTGLFQAIARSRSFEYISLAVVALNAIWIAIDTDLNDADLLLNAHPVFILAENAFCLAFFGEWVVKFFSFERKISGLKDSWFVFDSLLVFMMVMETWVMTLLILAMGGAGGIGGNASILRIARLLRLSRMARMARLLRALPELMIMIRGMVAAARSVFFTLCLLIIVLYVFAIAFTQLTVETTVGEKYFKTVPESMFTLLIYGTLLDNIGIFANELGRETFHVAVLFFIFVLIAALTIMNMLIGVLCEVVNAVAATEKEEMLVTYVNQKLQRVVSLLDTDGGGTISKNEFLQILDNVDAVRCLNDVGVDVIGLVDFVDFIFENEDTGEEDEDVELDFGKFMDVVLQLRGCNNATVKDVVDLRKLVKKSVLDMKTQMSQILQLVNPQPMEATRNCIPSKTNIGGDKNGVNHVPPTQTLSSQLKLAPELLAANDQLVLEKLRQMPDPILVKDALFNSVTSSEPLSDVLTKPNDCQNDIAEGCSPPRCFDPVESESTPAPIQASVQTLLLRPQSFDEAMATSIIDNAYLSPLLATSDLTEARATGNGDERKFAAPPKHFGNGTKA